MSDFEDFALALAAAQQQGDLEVTIGVAAVVELISVIQLASRHPGAKISPTIQNAIQIARQLQEALGGRAPELDRFLERGWHPVFDVERTEPPF